jgi:hypothetical protein
MTLFDYLLVAGFVWMAFKLGQASILSLLKEDLRRRIISGELAVSENIRDALDIPQEECKFDVERVGEHYYAYASNGEFLAQGPDFRTMFQTIKQRFPGRNFRINKLQSELTEEESQRMVLAIYETFGESNDKSNP